MPLNVKTLTSKTNTLVMEFAGEEVHITYKSGIITPAWEAKYRGQPDGVYQQAAELISEWDILDDSKPPKPYPISVDSLKELPLEFVVAVVAECALDIVPNARTSRQSGDSSFGA